MYACPTVGVSCRVFERARWRMIMKEARGYMPLEDTWRGARKGQVTQSVSGILTHILACMHAYPRLCWQATRQGPKNVDEFLSGSSLSHKEISDITLKFSFN